MALWFAGAYGDNTPTPARSTKRVNIDSVANRPNLMFSGLSADRVPLTSPRVYSQHTRLAPDQPCNRTHIDLAPTDPVKVMQLGQRYKTPQRVRTAELGYSVNPLTLLPMTGGAAEDPRRIAQFNDDIAMGRIKPAENKSIGGTSKRHISTDGTTILYADSTKDEVGLLGGNHMGRGQPDPSPRIEHPSACERMYPQKEFNGVPFDTEPTYFSNSMLHTQKRMPSAPSGRRIRSDEDNFLIKTSRNRPPVEQSEQEGFALLHSCDPGRSRIPMDGLGMANRPGKVKSDFVTRTKNARISHEDRVLLERTMRSEAAGHAEVSRLATSRTHDVSYMLSKNRSNAPASSHNAPFAKDLSAPHQERVGKVTPWWRRA